LLAGASSCRFLRRPSRDPYSFFIPRTVAVPAENQDRAGNELNLKLEPSMMKFFSGRKDKTASTAAQPSNEAPSQETPAELSHGEAPEPLTVEPEAQENGQPAEAEGSSWLA
jgi:hypothetical protein